MLLGLAERRIGIATGLLRRSPTNAGCSCAFGHPARSHIGHCPLSNRLNFGSPAAGVLFDGITRRIVRGWVLRFNASEPRGLIDRETPGQPSGKTTPPRGTDGDRQRRHPGDPRQEERSWLPLNAVDRRRATQPRHSLSWRGFVSVPLFTLRLLDNCGDFIVHAAAYISKVRHLEQRIDVILEKGLEPKADLQK